MLLLSLFACKNVEPAPEDIDGLSHYFWQHYDDEEDDALAEGIKNAFIAIDPENLEEPLRGSISDLSLEELTLVGKENEENYENMAGIYFANIINCPISVVEKGVYALNQAERHEGDYTEYNREYTSDLDAYEARETNRLYWTTNYSVEQLTKKMSVEIFGETRYTADIDEEQTPHGAFFLARGVMGDDALFEGSDDKGMFQDYQLEVYFQLSENQTVHYFTIWRDVLYAPGMDFSSEGLQNLVLDGMIDWDLDAEAECQ